MLEETETTQRTDKIGAPIRPNIIFFEEENAIEFGKLDIFLWICVCELEAGGYKSNSLPVYYTQLNIPMTKHQFRIHTREHNLSTRGEAEGTHPVLVCIVEGLDMLASLQIPLFDAHVSGA